MKSPSGESILRGKVAQVLMMESSEVKISGIRHRGRV
jgi:hypothetical protein